MSKKVYSKKTYEPVKSESAFFLQAAFVIIIVCLLFEIFVSNARHFVTHWGDGQVDLNNAKYQLVSMVSDKQTGLFVPKGKAQIIFPNINKRIVTVYIDAVFDENVKMQSFQINYGSEEHSNRTTAAFNVINGVEESKYVILQTSGNVSHMSIIYGTQNPTTSIRNITLNKPVPLKIFWPKVLLFSIIAFSIVVIKRKKLFSLPLMEDSVNQKMLTMGIMLTFIAYLFLLMLFTAPFSLKQPFMKNFATDPGDQFNSEVVNAILDGHTYLNIEPTEEFLALKNPYDWEERIATNVNPPWDHVYYNGKFYSYFGIVPVLVLSLPAKLITGRYISTRVAVFIFSALASVFLMLVWRHLVFRYMKKMPLGMYALGQLAVAMCSMLSFLTVRPKFYEAAISSALFFTALGFWLVLGSSAKKTRWIEITAGSLCMAMAVGCRANYMFFLLLIPVALFEELKEQWNDKKRFFCLCACVAVPITLIACGLMWYNYIRFGSVFEFGSNYQITVSYMKANNYINPIAKAMKFLVGFFSYLAPSFRVSASFPFLYLSNIDTGLAFKTFLYNTSTFGLLALPVIWFLFGIGAVRKIINKQRKPIFHLLIAMICLGFLQISVVVLSGGIVNRYCADFFWLFVFSGLLCAYFVYEEMAKYQERIIQIQSQLSLNLCDMAGNVITTIMFISIILMFLVTLSGDGEGGALIWNNNPAIYYFIQRLLGFNTW